MWNDRNLQPRQHFARRIHPDWGNGSEWETRSRFKLLFWQLPRGNFQNYYCNPYDALGHFMSRLLPAPAAANRNNFFLPMTAVYAKWCSQIAGHAPAGWGVAPRDPEGTGDWPLMYQCTWRPLDDRTFSFSLGSSVGGLSYSNVACGRAWPGEVAKSRKEVLTDSNSSWNFQNLNWRDKPGETDWGNCAETYPFVQIFARYVHF